MTDHSEVAYAYLRCNAESDYGPPGALCNNNTTASLVLGSGNDVTFDAGGWTLMFDNSGQPIVRCPTHATVT